MKKALFVLSLVPLMEGILLKISIGLNITPLIYFFLALMNSLLMILWVLFLSGFLIYMLSKNKISAKEIFLVVLFSILSIATWYFMVDASFTISIF